VLAHASNNGAAKALGTAITQGKERKETQYFILRNISLLSPKRPHFDPKMSPNYLIANNPLFISVSRR
jgi:hypothetical protein